jgi:hypothetical protein
MLTITATAAAAQRAGGPAITFEASGRASTELNVRGATAGAKVAIEYGQTHAKGREVFGALVPFDTVWRAGANRATHLTTDIPLTIGGTRVAPGTYSLALRPSRTGGQLIINSRTRQWGIPYSAEGELARIPMQARTLREPVETFTIALVPGTGTPVNSGTLTMTWGTMQYSVDFTTQP